MQELKPIRVFLEVAALRSFSAAARSLRMTPATVTRTVARLEEDLGHQLLLRTTRQVSLTSAGAVVAARYRTVIEEFDKVTRDLEQDTQPHRGRLSVNAPMSFGMRLMPGLVDSFRLAYPNIALSVTLEDQLIDIVDEGSDLAIRISSPPTDKSTIWRKICEVPRMAVAAPQLFERRNRPNTPDELERDLCLSYSSRETPEVWRFRKGAARRTVTAGASIVSNNGDFLYELALAGAGVAVLPEFIVKKGLRKGQIEQVLPDWETAPLWLSLYYPPYDALPPLVATFTDFFEAYLNDADGFRFASQP
ncbi:LysR family transcriptional regulator [Leisingera sp. XS_AS12]|uniref:LysR family transcriptional regulator n=1 Tax=Leisingera sp. XS_AS12 TaxID=3241294 RepID=UPI0035124626